MPVGLRLNFPENTLDDYDKVVKALNFPAEWPDGLIVHSSHEVEGHTQLLEVWETRVALRPLRGRTAPDDHCRDARGPCPPTGGDRGTRAPQLLRTRLTSRHICRSERVIDLSPGTRSAGGSRSGQSVALVERSNTRAQTPRERH